LVSTNISEPTTNQREKEFCSRESLVLVVILVIGNEAIEDENEDENEDDDDLVVAPPRFSEAPLRPD
jgi:hypothetical protein